MFVAQLRNKLSRPEEDMEDLLTSNAFGVWRYLPIELARVGLVGFLQTARRLDGAAFQNMDNLEDVDLRFWPWIQEGGAKGAEPDVLIECSLPGPKKCLVMIEAKYLSPKSSLADEDDPRPNDQLAREMHNLRRLAARRRVQDYALIYVTAHTAMPQTDLEEAVKELREKTGNGAPDRLFWTSWRLLPQVLQETMSLCQDPSKSMLGDLRNILLNMGLRSFSGIDSPGWRLNPLWSFATPKKATSFAWFPVHMGSYDFMELPTRFSWGSRYGTVPIAWRMNYDGVTRKANPRRIVRDEEVF